ncbi:hypothetical protein PAI11_01060 [Patulibacter medicamentivorans]|uniref:Uncharacterized protein n=1 Tax=Patulibacter medicamentivorans TaxID=1097667 RepID=H0E001_9ACTN|nr:hypothetical protein PAI11_01060 [Patulibacter medicamentivorans]
MQLGAGAVAQLLHLGGEGSLGHLRFAPCGGTSVRRRRTRTRGAQRGAPRPRSSLPPRRRSVYIGAR